MAWLKQIWSSYVTAFLNSLDYTWQPAKNLNALFARSLIWRTESAFGSSVNATKSGDQISVVEALGAMLCVGNRFGLARYHGMNIDPIPRLWFHTDQTRSSHVIIPS